jgi:hypothetical protein
MAKLQSIPYKNSIGQTIFPGDRVISVASGYCHNTSTREGVFAGVVNGSPSVIVDDTKWGYWNEEGKDVGYGRRSEQGVTASHRPYKRRSTLPLGRVYKLAL